jgi:hypothetical protein
MSNFYLVRLVAINGMMICFFYQATSSCTLTDEACCRARWVDAPHPYDRHGSFSYGRAGRVIEGDP